MPEFRYINKPIKRVDGLVKVTGAAKFMQDMAVPGQLVGKILYSPYAHAKIKSIKLEKALKVPGVASIITHEDLPPLFDKVEAFEPGMVTPPLPFSFMNMFRGWGFQTDGVIRCAGSPVAAVAAKTEEAALDALDLIEVEYEPLPVLLDPEESIKPGAPQVYPDIPNNTLFDWKGEIGDVEKGFREADMIFDEVGETQPQSHFTPDPRGAVAWWEGDRPVVCSSSMQPACGLLPGVAQTFGLPESKVKIMGPPYMGGCYGGRGFNDNAFAVMALLLARKARQPVKLSLSREEEMMALARCSTRLYAKVGAKKDGTITAVDYRGYLNPGSWFYPPWSLRYYTHLFKVIKCPNIRAEARMVATNRLFGGGAYRGFAYMEAFLVTQPILCKIAQKLGIDFAMLLPKHLWRGGEKAPHIPGSRGADGKVTGGTFLTIGSDAVDEAMRKGKELIGWDYRKPGEYVGVGYCLPAGTQFASNIEIRMNKDGSIQLETGIVEIGAGQHTTMTYMAAEALGVPPEMIHVTKGYDSEKQPWDGGQRSEKTTFCGGLAIIDGAKDFRQKVFVLCSRRLGVKPEELELQEGVVFVKADPSKKMPLSAIGQPIAASGTFHPDFVRIAWSAGGVICFVRLTIDRETGMINLKKVVMLNDAGLAINPPVVHTQNMGTLSGGLGFALSEEVIYDKEGRVLNTNPAFYGAPTIMDMPEEFVSEILESHDPFGPFGAKGAGERVLTPSILAVSSAVQDALKAKLDTPLTPDKILKALGKIG